MSSGVTTRYLGIAKGAVVITGNTFGLDKQRFSNVSSDTYSPGNLGSQGVYLTLSNTGRFPTNWASIYTANQLPSPIGIIRSNEVSTTLQIGSSARLYIPPTVKRILHAELVWYANINESAGVTPDKTIQFIHPASSSNTTPIAESIGPALFKVKYDLTTAEITDTWRIYVRSADVTNYIVRGENTYSVTGVSAVVRGGADESNCSGWCLLVAYEDDTMDYNNLSIYVMTVPVSQNSVQISIPNVVTPPSGTLKGKAVMAAAEGDIRYSGDYVIFGATTSATTRLSIGNHTNDNFFVGEISIGDNDPDISGATTMGQPDTRGSMGRNNHNLTNSILGARHGIDITRVDISNTLSYNQTSAFMRFGTNSDAYIPIAFGTQIKVFSSLTKTASRTVADVGDTIRYTSTIINGGSSIAWKNVYFQDNVPDGTTFVPGTVRVYYNNVLQTGFGSVSPNVGFSVKPTLSRADIVRVEFDVIVTDYSLIQNGRIENDSSITYTIPDSNGVEFQITEKSPIVTTIIEHGELIINKQNTPASLVTCTNIITYTVTISNIGTVPVTVAINQFSDPCPAGMRYVGGVTSSSNQTGYDVTSITFNSTGTAIVNTKVLTIRLAETITIVFSGTPIC